MLFFDSRSASEFLKESLICRLPAVYTIAEYLGRHFFEERCVGAYELAVLLVAWNIFPDQGQGFALELPEIAVLRDLGVVDKPLASDPFRHGCCLLLGRIYPEFPAFVHEILYHPKYTKQYSLDPPPGLRPSRGNALTFVQLLTEQRCSTRRYRCNTGHSRSRPSWSSVRREDGLQNHCNSTRGGQGAASKTAWR